MTPTEERMMDGEKTKRPGFRLVYRVGKRWRWHANMTHRNTPPRSWTNAAGWSRLRIVAWAKAWLGWLRLRIGVERDAR